MEIVHFTALSLLLGIVITYVLMLPIRYIPKPEEKMSDHFNNVAEFSLKLAIVVDTGLFLAVCYFAYMHLK
jgi:hypothetical protein